MPFTVYMDSSDYSNLASAAGSAPFGARQRWLNIQARIMQAKADGKAVFRFSYPIVMEAYPTSREHLGLAVGRAEAIREVCGQSCLLDFMSLMAEEGKAVALQSEPLRKAAACRDDGAWHPNPDGLPKEAIADFRRNLPTTMGELLKDDRRLNRKQRRELKSSLLTRDGMPTNLVKSLYTPSQRQSVNADIGERFHLPPAALIADIPVRVLLGELPASALGDLLGAVLRDVPTLFRQDAVREHEGALFHWIRSTGQALSDPLRKARSEILEWVERWGLDELRLVHAKLGLGSRSDELAATIRSRLLQSIWTAEGPALRIAGVRERVWQESVEGSASGTLPALASLVTACSAHLVMAFRPSTEPRQPRDSDGGDLIHMMYLPYVDVFRCDGYAATVAAEVVRRLGLMTRVVTSMEDALDAVGA